MIKHIVMFRLAEFETVEAKTTHLQKIKEALEALTPLIEPLHDMRVFLNVNSSEEYDFMLEADLDSLSDVKAYADHPAHMEVVRKLIAPFKVARACVDYEV